MASYLGIPGAQHPKADVVRLTKDWLQAHTELQWLMIVDNADDVELFFGPKQEARTLVAEKERTYSNLAQYFPRCPQGAILVTTRDKQIGVKFSMGPALVELKPLKASDSFDLISRMIGTRPKEKEEIDRLLVLLDHLPLAVAQAAAFIQENTLTVGQYLGLLEKPAKDTYEVLSIEFEALGRSPEVPNAVTATLILSLDKVKERNPRAGQILSRIAFYDRQDIPQELLLQKNGKIDLDFVQACGLLKAFSLLLDTSTPGIFGCHRLVHITIRIWLARNNQLDINAIQALSFVLTSFPDQPCIEDWSKCALYLPHALSLIRVMESLELQNRSAMYSMYYLVLMVSKYLWDRRRLEEITPLNSLGLRIAESLFKKNDPRILRIKHRRATELLAMHRLREAEELELQVLVPYHNLPYDQQFLFSLTGLAEIWKLQGQVEPAERLLNCAETIAQKILDKQESKHADIQADLAEIYRLEGRLPEAESLAREYLLALESRAGDHSLLMLKFQKCLALVLRAQGRYLEEKECLSEMLQKQTAILGSDNPEVLQTMDMIASNLHAQGCDEEACLKLPQSCEIPEKGLGSHSSATAVRLDIASASSIKQISTSSFLKYTFDTHHTPEITKQYEDFFQHLERRCRNVVVKDQPNSAVFGKRNWLNLIRSRGSGQNLRKY